MTKKTNFKFGIVNKYRIFTGVEASAFAKVPIKWDFDRWQNALTKTQYIV